MMKKLLVTIPLLITLCCVQAQNKPTAQKPDSSLFVLGVVDKIWYTQLSEERILNIYLPEGYNKDSATLYPVIYLLDGSANEDFIHIVGLVQFLTMIEAMPKSIVVGIANVDRRRDFTYPTTIARDKKDYPTTGSSAKFMAFIEDDLQPYVQKKYKVSASKTIIGQSLGGLFAAEVLLKKPDLFNHYIIISPSFWWDNESLLNEAPKLLAQHANHDSLQVYISVGNEGKQMDADDKKLVELLNTQPTIKTTFLSMPDETHLTILHNSVYKGLQIVNGKK